MRLSLKQPEYFNSAGRLLAMLTSIPKGKSLLEVLPALLGVISTDQIVKQEATLQFLYELKLVYKEFCQDMQEAKITPKQRELILAPLANIGLTVYPTSLSGGIRDPLPTEIDALRICSGFIKEEGEITVDEIESIRKAIVALRTLIEKSKVSSALKKALLDIIRHCESAISSYKIHGAKGLRRSIKSMVADLKEIYDNDDFKEELKKSVLWNDIVSLIRLTDTVASKNRQGTVPCWKNI